MDDFSFFAGRALSEALSQVDSSTLVFLTIANLVQLAVVLFLVIVAPIWIIRHYNARRDETAQLTEREKTTLADLENVAAHMEGRMTTLEKILESDKPNWREPT